MSSDSISKFIDGTKDPVEQIYGAIIVKFFPNYAELWLKFIGDPKKAVPQAYGLIIPSSVNKAEAEKINNIYQELCMAHYSLFCHLAGAHFQSEQLEKILQMEDSKDKTFQHWETFEVCYFHLGSAYYQLYHLWGLVFQLKGEIIQRGVTQKLQNYYNDNKRSDFWQNFSKTAKSIKDIRDNIVHFSRLGSMYQNGEFLIPFDITQKVWGKQIESGQVLETSRKIKSDIKTTEDLFNKIHEDLKQEIENCLERKNIKINYEKE